MKGRGKYYCICGMGYITKDQRKKPLICDNIYYVSFVAPHYANIGMVQTCPKVFEGLEYIQIDYVFWWNLVDDLQARDVEIIQQSGIGSKAASDHLPVVATFC